MADLSRLSDLSIFGISSHCSGCEIQNLCSNCTVMAISIYIKFNLGYTTFSRTEAISAVSKYITENPKQHANIKAFVSSLHKEYG